MKKKSDVLDIFIRFKVLVENFLNKQMIQLYTDNGGEYLALNFYFWLIMVSPTSPFPHTPERNGYLDCHHRHIVETSLTLLHHDSMFLSFWLEAFATAIYLIN